MLAQIASCITSYNMHTSSKQSSQRDGLTGGMLLLGEIESSNLVEMMQRVLQTSQQASDSAPQVSAQLLVGDEGPARLVSGGDIEMQKREEIVRLAEGKQF